MKRLHASLWLAVVLLAGCQFLGLTQPDTFKQRLLVGYESVAAVREQTGNLLVAGHITADDAENIQQQADVAREGLDIALALSKLPDMPAAESRLDATLVILRGLTTYLESKQ